MEDIKMFKCFEKWDYEMIEVGVEFVHPDEGSRFYDLYIIQDDETTINELASNLWKKYNEYHYFHEMFMNVTPKYGTPSYWRYNGYDLELM